MKVASFSAILALGYYVLGVQGNYILWFEPGAAITKLYSTMIVPSAPPPNSGYHALWPGLEPKTDDFVFQNVLEDDKPTGKWAFSTWYGPYDSAGDFKEYSAVSVAPGNALTSTFDLSSSGAWTDDWTLEPSNTKGGVTVAPGTFSNTGTLTQALFAIELQSYQGVAATWDFGQLAFENITIEAETGSSTWCTSPYIQGGMQYTMSTPTITVSGGSTTCHIDSLVLVGPTDNTEALVHTGTSNAVVDPAPMKMKMPASH